MKLYGMYLPSFAVFFALLLSSCNKINSPGGFQDDQGNNFNPDSMLVESVVAIPVPNRLTPTEKVQSYEVRIYWRIKNPNITSFNVYRDHGDGWDLIAENVEEREYVDQEVQGLWEYKYAVRGIVDNRETHILKVDSPVRIPQTYFEGLKILVQNSGNGFGVVTGRGIDCGTDCSENYLDMPDNVVMTATPKEASVFSGWEGSCKGQDNPCTVDLSDEVTSIRAVFQPEDGEIPVSYSFSFEDGSEVELFNGAKIVDEGKIGKALKLDGNNDYAVSGVRVDNYGDYSVAAWLNLQRNKGTQAAISQNGLLNYQWRLGFIGSEYPSFAYIRNHLLIAGSRHAFFAQAQTLHEWVHLVGVKNNRRRRLSIYINGELMREVSIRNDEKWQDDSTITFGRMISRSNPSSYFGGLIDEVQVQGRAMTEAQILDLYNSQK